MSFWEGRAVLVTGAGGFIGSALVEALVTSGARVRALVRYNSRGDAGLLRLADPRVLRQVELLPASLLDSAAVDAAVEGISVVLHLGALISIPYSYRHPIEVAKTNLMGTLNVLMACKRHAVDRLVHTSSSEVYGSALRVPIDEDHPLQAQSPYAASKIGADKLAESFYRSYALPVVTVRPFNTFGPRQSARAIIPTILTQALSGDVVRLGNLDTRRDFTYVTDTVRGFALASETMGIEGQVFNLGSGNEVRMGDLAQMALRLAGSNARVEVDEQRLRPAASEVMRLVADAGRAHRQIGWQPRVSLEDGLLQTIRWMRDHLDLYRPGRYEF